MKPLSFKVYINVDSYCDKEKGILAVVEPMFYLPKGNCDYNGKDYIKDNKNYFRNLYDLGTFFADWFDIVENHDLVQSEVYLNLLTQHKVYKADNLIKIIDLLAKINIETLKQFPEI